MLNGGVTKKKATGKPKTRNQKLRQAKTLQRAEAVVDQKEKKVDSSKSREQRRRERRKLWEEVNGDTGKLKNKKAKSGIRNGGVNVEGGDTSEEEDRDGDVHMLPSIHAPKKKKTEKKTRMVPKLGKLPEDVVDVELGPERTNGELVWGLTEEEYSTEEEKEEDNEDEDGAHAFKRMEGFGDAVPAPTEIIHGIEVPVPVAGDEHEVVVPPENSDGIDEIS